MNAKQNQNDDAQPETANYYHVEEDACSFPGRVGRVEETEDVDGTLVVTLSFDGARENQNYTLDYLEPLGEWADYASDRLREFVADARDAEQIGTPEVVKVGDTGVIMSPEFENGSLTGRVFEVADRYGLNVAEVNFSEETVLFQDPARVE